MHVQESRLSGLKKLVPPLFRDERGFFLETYRQGSLFQEFVQDNLALSYRNVVRGLHFQRNPGQAKLVFCSFGTIWDVVLDIRSDSPTFGQWEAFFLDDKTHEQLFVPVGFAHGYCVLSETAVVQYKVSAFYDPQEERSIRWNDPDLQIPWPVSHPVVSARDQSSPLFREVFPCMCGS